jgi:hypothetical protein
MSHSYPPSPRSRVEARLLEIARARAEGQDPRVTKPGQTTQAPDEDPRIQRPDGNRQTQEPD